MDIMKFLNNTPSRREPALTLFGDHKEKTTLASKVIIAGKSIKDGFDFGFRVIQVKCHVFIQYIVDLPAVSLIPTISIPVSGNGRGITPANM